MVTEPHAKFVIPDIALLEMCKGDRWKETMLGSLAILSAHPGRVYHSISIGEGLKYELKYGKSIEGKLFPRGFRNFTRSILSNVAAGGSGNAIEIIRNQILTTQRDMQLAELNHLNNQKTLFQNVELIEAALAGEPLKILRSGKSDRKERLGLIKRVSLNLCSNFLISHGLSKHKTDMFLKQKPLVLRFFYAHVRHAVEWAAKGGVRSMPSAKITNDILDQDYVLIGSFFQQLLSKETKVQKAYADLRELIQSG